MCGAGAHWASKVGCVVLGGHGIDLAATGLQEAWTGQAEEILFWAKSAPANDVLRLSASTADDVGVVLLRGATDMVKASELIVVLRKKPYNGMPYYVLSAYLGVL